MRPGIRLACIAASLALASGVAACGSGSSSASKATAGKARSSTMTIKTFIFRPHTLTVAAGTTVRFVNDDAILHTVTSGTRTQTTTHPDGRFDARLDGKGSTYSHTFSRPGTYPLYCSIHPGMTASVVVR